MKLTFWKEGHVFSVMHLVTFVLPATEAMLTMYTDSKPKLSSPARKMYTHVTMVTLLSKLCNAPLHPLPIFRQTIGSVVSSFVFPNKAFSFVHLITFTYDTIYSIIILKREGKKNCRAVFQRE